MFKKTFVALSVATLATGAAVLPVATAKAVDTSVQIAQCAAKTNPCNPCAAKNPCNPCAAKNPCNPCAAENPCAAKNPCNPCAAKNPCNPCKPKTN